MLQADLSAPLATVLGASIGLVGVLIGGLLTVWHQRRLERDKASYVRSDTRAKETSAAAQQLAISMASAVHSACWLTWLAGTRPDALTQGRIDKYDEEQHATLPKVLGYLSTLSALDPGLYAALRPEADELFKIDAEIGEIGLEFSKDPLDTARRLAEYHPRMLAMEREIPERLGGVLGDRLQMPVATRLPASHTTPKSAG
jgi:hypothetical protein